MCLVPGKGLAEGDKGTGDHHGQPSRVQSEGPGPGTESGCEHVSILRIDLPGDAESRGPC